MIGLLALLAVQAPLLTKPVTVAALRAHLHEWTGRRVVVRGWAYDCGGDPDSRCYLGPSRTWHHGRDRLRLLSGAGLTTIPGRKPIEVVVQGTVEEFQCANGDICLDGESALHVDAIDMGGRRIG